MPELQSSQDVEISPPGALETIMYLGIAGHLGPIEL